MDLRTLVAATRDLVQERRSAGETHLRKLGRMIMAWLAKPQTQLEFERHGKVENIWEDPLGASDPTTVSFIEELEIRVVSKSGLRRPTGNGSWTGGGFNTLRVTLTVPRDFLGRQLSKLYPTLQSTLRHEIEHALQTLGVKQPGGGRKVKKYPKYPTTASFGLAYASYKNARDYLLHPKELEANAVAAYYEAKRSKRPVDVVIRKFVEKCAVGLTGSMEEKKKLAKAVETALRKEIRTRFPKALRKRMPRTYDFEKPQTAPPGQPGILTLFASQRISTVDQLRQWLMDPNTIRIMTDYAKSRAVEKDETPSMSLVVTGIKLYARKWGLPRAEVDKLIDQMQNIWRLGLMVRIN